MLAQNDLEFLREIQLLLSMFGLNARIYSHGKDCEKTITYANGDSFVTKRKACWRLSVGGLVQYKKFISEIGFGVPAKQQKAINNLNLKHSGIKSNYVTGQIVKIEQLGAEQTYCLTEPLTNTIAVAGIVTGQCRCSLQYLAKSFGFDSKGYVKHITSGHDEYVRQKESNKS